jgi:PAS domain S-box-containing protein
MYRSKPGETTSPLSRDTLQPCEQISSDILENLPVSITILTPEGKVLHINRAPLEAAQLQRADMLGKPFVETPWWSGLPDSQQRLLAAIEQARRGEIVQFEVRICSGAGKYLDRAATITPHLDEAGSVEYLIYSSTDITVRKRAEDELCALVDAMPQLVWIGRPDGVVEYHNQRWHDYTRLPLEQSQENEWFGCLHPDDRQKTLAAWYAAVQTGESYEVEQRLRDGTTGAYRWFLARGAPCRDAQGTIIKWIGTLTDIDDQKRTEQILHASEERFRVLAETVPQLVWATQADGSLVYTNQRFADYTQAPPEALRGFGWRHFLHPDDYAAVVTIRTRSLETGDSYEIEYRLREGRTGNYRWFLARGAPVRDEVGRIVIWCGTCTDIEDQKRIEEALRQTQERAQALMESSIIGIVVVENDDTLIEANDAFLQMTGYTRAEVQRGMLHMPALIHPEDVPRGQQAIKELAVSQQMKPYETTYVCKDGSRLPVLMGGITLPHHPSLAIGFMLDNSARKELEQRKDEFISMASHELKTPLTSLKLQTQMLGKQLAKQDVPGHARVIARMEGQVKSLERLVGELLDVSKIQAGRLDYLQERVKLDDLLSDVVESMQQMSETHTIIVRGSAPHALRGDRGRLAQVFINLISNAIKYSPGANTIEIEISTRGEAICVSVRDHGMGIPKAQREKIFERFYRAVDPGQKAPPGLGMGLYIVAEIVKQHGGTITVDSERGEGSIFSVTLPVERDAVQEEGVAVQ